MTRDTNSYRKQGRAVFLAAMMVLSIMVVGFAGFSGSAAAVADNSPLPENAEDVDFTSADEPTQNITLTLVNGTDYDNTGSGDKELLLGLSGNLTLNDTATTVGENDVNVSKDDGLTTTSQIGISVNQTNLSTGDPETIDVDITAQYTDTDNVGTESFNQSNTGPGAEALVGSLSSHTFNVSGFDVSDVQVVPSSVQDGDTFDVTANVTNTGNNTDTQDIDLNVDGNMGVATETGVNLASGASTTVTFEDIVADDGGNVSIGQNDLNVSSDDDSADGEILVSDAGERASLTGDVRTETGAPVPNAEDTLITLTAQDGSGNPITIVDGVPLSEFNQNDLVADNPSIDSAGFNQSGDDAYTVKLPTFNGSSATDYEVEATLAGYEADDGTVEVFPDQTSRQDIRLESNLQPAEFGIAAVELDENGNVENVLGDGTALLANGELDNNASLIVYAQSQVGGPLASSQATLTHEGTSEFASGNGIFQNGTSNTSTLTLGLDDQTTLAAGDLEPAYDSSSQLENAFVDPNGDVSYATFDVTADAVDEALLSGTNVNINSDFLENFIINASIGTDGNLSVDGTNQDIEAYAGSNSTADYDSTNDTLTASADALYFVEGDKSVTGDIRDQSGDDVPSDVTVWVAYDAAPDKSYDAINALENANGESFFTTEVTSAGNYEITGLAGDETNFTVYATAPGFNSIPSSAVDPTVDEAVAAAEDAQTRTSPARTTTQDLVLQPEVRDFQIDLTAEDFESGDFQKEAEQPTGATSEVRVDVGARTAGDTGASFAAAPNVDVELEVVDANNKNSQIESTVTTNENGVAIAEFDAADTTEIVNISATITNADGDTYVTADNEGQGINDDGNQTQIDVFGSGEITGDVVNEDDQNVLNAEVQLEQLNATSGEFEVVRERRPLNEDLGSFAFVDVRSNDDDTEYRVRAFSEDEDGNEIDGTSRLIIVGDGTQNADVVVVDAVPDADPGDGDDGTDLNRFDTNNNGSIDFDEVLAAITANNEDTEIGGEPVTFDNVIDVIAAHNDGTQL